MKIDVLNIKGEKVEQITLNDEIFGITPNEDVLAQYLRVYMHNQRQGTASAKDRGEVSGGGKKPWKQKGTGRARVGSTRSPLWRHGGVTHGPKPKSWNLDLPKKVRRLATLSALSSKFATNTAIVLDTLSFDTPKTKAMVEVMNNIKAVKPLVVLNKSDVNTLKSGANIKNLKITQASVLNAYDVLNAKTLVFVKDAILDLQAKYLGKNVESKDENK